MLKYWMSEWKIWLHEKKHNVMCKLTCFSLLLIHFLCIMRLNESMMWSFISLGMLWGLISLGYAPPLHWNQISALQRSPTFEKAWVVKSVMMKKRQSRMNRSESVSQIRLLSCRCNPMGSMITLSDSWQQDSLRTKKNPFFGQVDVRVHTQICFPPKTLLNWVALNSILFIFMISSTPCHA